MPTKNRSTSFRRRLRGTKYFWEWDELPRVVAQELLSAELDRHDDHFCTNFSHVIWVTAGKIGQETCALPLDVYGDVTAS